ncbi:TBC1 domain family member 22B isoform X1 [Tachysurus ichikawai]
MVTAVRGEQRSRERNKGETEKTPAVFVRVLTASSEHSPEHKKEDMENFEMAALPLETQRNIEADSFWCMSKLLDGIQDNYTFAQPGIQKKVKALEELISRIDEDMHLHIQKCEVEYLQFAFRWMNNLLMRELPLRCTIRLWDTYQFQFNTVDVYF